MGASATLAFLGDGPVLCGEGRFLLAAAAPMREGSTASDEKRPSESSNAPRGLTCRSE